MGSADKKLRVGSIVKPHGLKGALKVYPTTDNPECFSQGTSLVLDNGSDEIPVEVRSASRFKNLYIVTFSEFSKIEEVEGFRGADLLIDRSDVPELGEDEYFISDLIGLIVKDEQDNELGTLKEVLVTGANDVYSVARQGKPELLIPAIKDCIMDINIKDKTMTVRLLPGME